MAADVTWWDERITKDLDERMRQFDQTWTSNRNVIKNTKNKSFIANLAREFATTVRNRLINQNYMIKVTVDDPDYAKRANDMTIMSNSVARSVGLKSVFDNVVETALWAGTGWIEVGHSLDSHALDPSRSFRGVSSAQTFDKKSMEDEYEEVPKDQVQAYVGDSIDDVEAFDPFNPPKIKESGAREPKVTFDPSFGAPWIKEVSPFLIVMPCEVKNFEDADYVTKLVLISKKELATITDTEIPEEVLVDRKYDSIVNRIPGSKYIKDKVLIAVTFVRRDRNDPEYSSYYIAHVLGHPEIEIKCSPNPYGGMISLIPVKIRTEMDIWDKAYIEDMIPHTEEHSRIVKAAYKRIRMNLNAKWSLDQGTSVAKNDLANLNNPDYTGHVKLESGSSEGLKPIALPGLTQDIIQGINLSKQLAQGASNLSDMDRGAPIKKISARQTGALLENSQITLDAMRVPVAEAAAEVVLKLIHMLNLFSAPREYTYNFGSNVVSFKPGSQDFTASYTYRFSVKDLEGPADPEQQIVLVQFVTRILPLLKEYYDLKYIADNVRREFGFGPEAMNPAIYAPPGTPAGAPGAPAPNPVLQPNEFPDVDNMDPSMLPSGGGGPEHPERLAGDQGIDPNMMSNIMSGAMRG